MLLNEEMESTRRLLYDVLDGNDRESALRLSQALDELITKYYVEVYKNK